MYVYMFVGGDVWGEWACKIKLELLTKADDYWERRLWVKGYKSDREQEDHILVCDPLICLLILQLEWTPISAEPS